MGELSKGRAPGAAGPHRKGRSWLAALPFALAWTFAAATLNAALAPAILHEPGLEEAPLPASAPAPPPPPAHDVVFESTELISV
jgi:hypothetical protein